MKNLLLTVLLGLVIFLLLYLSILYADDIDNISDKYKGWAIVISVTFIIFYQVIYRGKVLLRSWWVRQCENHRYQD